MYNTRDLSCQPLFYVLCCSQIDVAPVGMSKGVRKLLQAKVPNMAKFSDVSEYIER